MTLKNNPVNFCKPGDIIEIYNDETPEQGQEIFHLSSRDLDLPEINENKFNAYQVPLNIEITLTDNCLKIIFLLDSKSFEFKHEISTLKAQKECDMTEILTKLFSQSNKNFIQVENISLINKTNLPSNKIFIQPSLLKNVKNNFYIYLNDVMKKNSEFYTDILETPFEFKFYTYQDTLDKNFLSCRENLNPKNNEPIPFININNLNLDEKTCFLPLPPVIFDETKFLNTLEKTISSNPDKTFLLGLNNIHHLYYAKKLENLDNVFFFTDFFIYIANRFALSFYLKNIKKLIFSYYWIEDKNTNHNLPLLNISNTFNPPLFYSLGCFYKHNMGGKCPNNCKKNYNFELKNQEKSFKVICKDCVTYLFLSSSHQ
ncbi:hypothetical protein KKC59_04215 [bacterium]|nr:hypothetical protein [bacterium]